MQDCLVLDSSYKPIGFCNWQDAVKLMFENIAYVVREDQDGRKLHSPSLTIDFPRVICVKNYVSKEFKKKIYVPNLRNISVRDNNQCQYCSDFLYQDEQTLDHVLPRSRGGGNTWENLVLACEDCNRFKADRLPEEAGMALLKKPVKPSNQTLNVHFSHKVRPEWKDWMNAGFVLD